MRWLLIYTLTIYILLNSSCNGTPYGRPAQQPAEILKNQASFLNYYNKLKLSRNFIALDTAANIIEKGEFLKQVATGNYLPVLLSSKDSSVYYQLYRETAYKDFMGNIKAMAQWEYTHYQMEGKPIPGLNYTDINGNVYNPQTTKDKIVVLKCWFIHCLKCNEEIPALNTLVDRYKSRKDVVFVSLAFDAEKDLRNFVARKRFNYAVASIPEEYMENQLGVSGYPTHIVINKKGLVVKVVSDYEEMERVLDKEALQ